MRSNLPLLTRVAQRLDPLLSELTFVGGATTELFFTSPAASEVRMTRDADVICEVAGRVEYHRLGEWLRELGFKEDTSPGAPLCRWTSEGGILDIMPVDEDIVVVIAYRDELVPEVGAEPAASRAWIQERIRRHLIDHPDSEYAITGSLPGAQVVPGFVPRVLARVQALAGVR